MYELKLRMWLERDGRFIMSEGRARLLRRIEQLGSLSKAAKDMGMSYRHAWGVIKRISESSGGEVVESVRGGRIGGKTRLTPFGQRLLQEYDSKVASLLDQFEKSWRKPSVTADGIVTRYGKILLVRRGKEPFKGRHALPGGFADYGEPLEKCVIREVLEETGVKTEIIDLIGIYSAPDRDPRGHFVTAVYHLKPLTKRTRAGDDADSAEWLSLDDLPELAFDHARIVQDFVSSTSTRKHKERMPR